MLWRGIDLSTFATSTLRGWIGDLVEEIKTIQGVIDRRTAAERSTVHGPTGGHPPSEAKAKGKESL